MNKKIFLLLPILVVAISLVGSSCNKSDSDSNSSGSGNNEQSSSEPKVAGDTSDTEEYFSDDAKVMFFYSDYCGWCTKQKEVLKELGKEGYRVKPMNVAKDQSLWQKYDIQGTPTLIAPDGTKSTGYAEKDRLRAFLDKYK